jgi:hypothetical protein
MKLTTPLASILLLFISSLASAAPTNSALNNVLVEKCNGRPTAAQTQAINKATAEAHRSQDACPEARKKEFTNEKNKQKRTLMKTNCTTNWTRYVIW